MNFELSSARRKGLAVRDALIFLVDWRVPMLVNDPSISVHQDVVQGVSSLLSVTLRCVADVLKSKIVARSGDAVGVIAFGARGPMARQGWPGVRIIRPLKPSDAEGVKLLQRLAKTLEKGDADHLLNLSCQQLELVPVPSDDEKFCFGADMPVEFDKALWAARHQFTALSSSRFSVFHRKRLFVFTNDYDPSRQNHSIRKQCISQMKDLADMGATIDVSILLSPSHFTDAETPAENVQTPKFFDELVYSDENDETEEKGSVIITTVNSFEELRTRVRRKNMSKRAIRKTLLILGPNYKIGVAIYALVSKARRPLPVELAASSSKPVFKITSNTCEAVGEILKPSGIRYTYVPDYLRNTRYTTPGFPKPLDDQGVDELSPMTEGTGENLSTPKVHGFTKSECVQAKAIGQDGLHLYGFRKQSVLRREYSLGPPKFLYPNDEVQVGSTKAFATLWKCMLRRKVVAIVAVRLSTSSGAGIRFAALVPQQELFTEDAEKCIPGGFHMHYLPYKNDIYTSWRKEVDNLDAELVIEDKNGQLSAVLKDEPESVAAAREMIRKLEMRPYSPNLFLNPDLQRFYTGLENAAGVESSYQPQDDLLNPKVDAMRDLAEKAMIQLKKHDAGLEFDGDEEAERFGTKRSKRAMKLHGAAVEKAKQKKSKIEKTEEMCEDDLYLVMYREKRLNKLKKPDLQMYCRAHGLRETGKKPILVIRVEDHIAEKLETSKKTS